MMQQQPVAKGYKDAEHMMKDDELKALRGRDDFKKPRFVQFTAGLTATSAPRGSRWKTSDFRDPGRSAVPTARWTAHRSFRPKRRVKSASIGPKLR